MDQQSQVLSHESIIHSFIATLHILNLVMVNSQFLYLSEQTGWRQLYLVSPFSGGDRGDPVALTPPTFDVESVSGADEELRIIYFIASPDDPLCRLGMVNYGSYNNDDIFTFEFR